MSGTFDFWFLGRGWTRGTMIGMVLILGFRIEREGIVGVVEGLTFTL